MSDRGDRQRRLRGLEKRDLKNRRILIVEDDGLNRFYLSKVLGRSGADVLSVDNGEEAVSACTEDNEYDLILMDVGLPGIDGVEATKQILAHCPEQRILLLTAHTSESDMRIYQQIAVAGIMAKPVREEILIERIIETIEA